MADIVDSFVAALKLDPRQYNDEIKKYRADRKNLAVEDAKYNREAQDGQKRTVEGIRSLRNETAGFLFMLAGASSVQSFTANLLTQDAATGRLAKNIGMATENLSAWQEAVKRSGGTAADADSSLRAMTSAFQSLQLTGSTGKDADFQGLGVTAADLRDPETALLKIASASQRMGRGEFTARAGRLGLNDATITLLSKGRVGVEQLLVQVRALGVATDQSAEDAQKFDTALAAIEQGIKGAARPAIEALANSLTGLTEDGERAAGVSKFLTGLFSVMGFVASQTAIGLGEIVSMFTAIGNAYDKLPAGVRGFVENIGAMATGGNYKNAWDYLGDAVGGEMGAEIQRKYGASDPLAKIMGTAPEGLGFGGAGDPRGVVSSNFGAGAIRSGTGSSLRAEQFFKANGFTGAQAKGITAAMVAENGSLDPSAHNRAGGGQGAYGLGQWRGARLTALRRRFGPNPTFDQQLQFMLEEMRGSERGAGSAVGGAGSAGSAARAMIDRFYRPGAGTAGDYARAGRFLGAPGAVGRGGGGSVTQTTTIGQIVIYSAATDAQGIAHDMRGALAKRGLVVQANTGLQP